MLAMIAIAEGIWPWIIGWALHITLFVWVSVHCLETKRVPSSSLLWIFIAWSFPLVGPLLYLAVGVDRLPEKGFRKEVSDRRMLEERRAREEEALPLAYWRSVHKAVVSAPHKGVTGVLNRALDAVLPEHPLLAGNTVVPLVDGDDAYGAMFEAIRGAREHIHLQSFIIRRDRTGREFLDLLADKAKEGVRVRVMYDHFGSTTAHLTGFFRRYADVPNMTVAGWTQANVFKRQFQVNLRNHRKTLVVDGRRAFTGGINLHDGNVSSPGHPAIRDYHFEVRGPVVQELQYTFIKDWHFMTDEDPDGLLTESHFPHIDPEGEAMVRLVNSGPALGRDALIDTLFAMIGAAEEDLIIVTAYFVPTLDIIRAIRAAALRGVTVRVIVPRKSNHVYAGFAARARYGELLDAGVRIFEREPPFMHAKALLVDQSMALVGTANMDVRSFHLNYESNMVVLEEGFVDRMKQIVLDDLAQSREVNLHEWKRRPAHRRVRENLAYLMMPQL